MTIEKSDLIVVPFNMLPAEKVPHPDHKEIEAQRIYIRDHIANRSNDELILDPPAMEFMATLGSDLMINAFACNFWVNGKINEDVVSYHPRWLDSKRRSLSLFITRPCLMYS